MREDGEEIDYSAGRNDPEFIEKIRDGRFVMWKAGVDKYGDQMYRIVAYPNTRAERFAEAERLFIEGNAELSRRLAAI